MARNSTNKPTPPTTPAQPNIGRPSNLPKGSMAIVDDNTPFARTISIDAAAATATAAYLVKLSDKHQWSYSVNTTFTFPKGTPAVAMAWAVRALRVDMQSRIRRAHSNKNDPERAAAPLAATWAKVDVTMPDEQGADPVKAAERDVVAANKAATMLRELGQADAADALVKSANAKLATAKRAAA